MLLVELDDGADDGTAADDGVEVMVGVAADDSDFFDGFLTLGLGLNSVMITVTLFTVTALDMGQLLSTFFNFEDDADALFATFGSFADFPFVPPTLLLVELLDPVSLVPDAAAVAFLGFLYDAFLALFTTASIELATDGGKGDDGEDEDRVEDDDGAVHDLLIDVFSPLTPLTDLSFLIESVFFLVFEDPAGGERS